MGHETRCVVRVRDADGAAREAEGTVLLETDELIVRGPARVRVPRATITDARVDGDTLLVTHAGGSVALVLGPDAAKWRAHVVAPPKPLIDKLDVKPGARVWVVDVDDAELLSALRARTPDVRVDTRPSAGARGCDVAFLGVEREGDLARIAQVAPALAERGALWVIHPKGRGGVPDTAILAAGRAAGLAATKVARVSATHTAEKLVRPRARGLTPNA